MPTYKEAGVDLDKADSLVDKIARIQSDAEQAVGPSLFQAFGQFASSFDVSDYDEPVVVTTCDGVGTKLILQKRYDRLESAGIDLVAMNVNDILTTGANPVLFLDYLAMAPLDEDVILPLVEGMADACEESNCVLAGGETAELPDMIEPGDVEVSGFCMGVSEKGRMLKKRTVEKGDRLVGIPSNGFHANGFSLVRAILRENPDEFDDQEIESFLTPTRIYYDSVQALLEHDLKPKSMVHVTGGGIENNLNRVIPEQLGAHITLPKWEDSSIRKVLNHTEQEEALRTFNMGIGWITVVDEPRVSDCLDVLNDAVEIGAIREGETRITIEN